MTMRDWLKHTATTIFAAGAAYGLFASGIATSRATGAGAGTIVSVVIFGGLFTAIFAAAAYCCHKRRYADLFMIGATLAAMYLCSLTLRLPRDFRWVIALRGWSERQELTGFMLFASMAFLFGPFYLFYQVVRIASRFAARRIPNGPSEPPQRLESRTLADAASH